MNALKNAGGYRLLRSASLIVLSIPYILYIVFVINNGRGPVDYETFMAIGSRLVSGSPVYGENSYYPMPFVMIFALFSLLPRALSIALWLILPVALVLLITKGDPLALAYAPVFSHFVGGQTAVFGLLGLWLYRNHQQTDSAMGGVGLGLTLLKPQLGLMPMIFAIGQWWQHFRERRRIPQQVWVWVATLLVLYLPGFFLMPDWPLQWLQSPRPLFMRALSSWVTRTLLFWFPANQILFWLLWGFIGSVLLAVTWLIAKKRLTLDLWTVWGFVISPLVHDYDLIQTVPLLTSPLLRWLAVIASLPGWWVIFFAYANDDAWYAFTLVAPVLLVGLLYQARSSSSPAS